MSDAVQQIKDRLSILDVVAPYVELHKAGKNYKGKSPFTNERTPSFFVSPDRGMYYCFSTSQGGDLFTFVQKMEGVDFKGALHILAEKAGVELVPEDPQKKSERDMLYEIVAQAVAFFEEQRRDYAPATDYLRSRGVTDATATAWRLGYAPGPPDGGWRELRSHFQQQGYTDEQLINAGLIKRAGDGKQPYDVFRDRLMFPIFDASGRPVAFSGRLLHPQDQAPKYVNSPETPLFHKSDVLYGYHAAKEGIRKFNFSLIVEGQFDVVMSHQAGYTNAVAVSGTSLTDQHAAVLHRLSDRVVLALDSDRAGVAAVMRATALLLARGMDVKVASLPVGQDPADLIKEDPKRFKQAIGSATHVVEFLLQILRQQTKDERTLKLRAREEIIPFLLHIQNRIDRDHFEHVMADTIGSTRDAVHQEVQRLEEQTSATLMETAVTETVATPAPLVDRPGQMRAYLAVVVGLLPQSLQQTCEAHFTAITGQSSADVREAVGAEVESALTFKTEEYLNSLHPKALAGELAYLFTELHARLLREALHHRRQQLIIAEQSGDNETVAAELETITVLQKQLGETQYDPEQFLVE